MQSVSQKRLEVITLTQDLGKHPSVMHLLWCFMCMFPFPMVSHCVFGKSFLFFFSDISFLFLSLGWWIVTVVASPCVQRLNNRKLLFFICHIHTHTHRKYFTVACWILEPSKATDESRALQSVSWEKKGRKSIGTTLCLCKIKQVHMLIQCPTKPFEMIQILVSFCSLYSQCCRQTIKIN